MSGVAKERLTLFIARVVVFTALVTAATIVLSVYFPLTRGYFNLGETMVYLSALVAGPLVGAFAGGVGSALADIILGYQVFAPGTLVIKAVEGYVAGILARRAERMRVGRSILLSAIIIGVYFIILLLVGVTIMAGELELSIYQLATVNFFVSPYFWIILALLGIITPAYYTFRRREEDSWLVLSLLTAGLFMVTGYYLYESLAVVTGIIPGIIPIAEVPLNIGQVVVGTAVAIPIYRAVKTRITLLAKT